MPDSPRAKILAITAGAARMYCGSCIRDNALAAELRRQGHAITLLPVYTPTLTDEENASGPRVFFGGISVYLQQHSALFRKTPSIFDRLWDSRWALRLAARRSIPVDPRLLGEMTVSMLRGEQGFQAKEIGKLARWLRSQPPPDIVTLPNSLLIALAGPIARVLKRPVCCTLQGEDLFLDQLPAPYRTAALELIRSNAEQVAGFAAVSGSYAECMCRRLGIPERKMHVVPLGINLDGHGQPPLPRGDTFTIGFLARIAPEKGLHLLAESYILLRRDTGARAARLEAAGYLAPEHRAYLRGIERRLAEAGLAHEFRYRGSLDRAGKIKFLRGLDLFSVPCDYDEPKGLSLLEAMANAVPAVQPHRGAFPEILEKTGGGILVSPGDAATLAEGVRSLWNDPQRRAELGRQGARGVREHYSSARMAARALEVYRCLSS